MRTLPLPVGLDLPAACPQAALDQVAHHIGNRTMVLIGCCLDFG